MRTRGEGVKKSQNFADSINGRPLSKPPKTFALIRLGRLDRLRPARDGGRGDKQRPNWSVYCTINSPIWLIDLPQKEDSKQVIFGRC